MEEDRKDPAQIDRVILAARHGRHEEALALVMELRDREIQKHAREERITTLWRMGRLEDALALASMVLERDPPDDDDGAHAWARIAACAGRIRLDRGDPPAEVRRFAVEMLERVLPDPMLLALLRDALPRTSTAARVFRLFVRGRCRLRGRPGVLGYFVDYRIAAASAADALAYAREIETSSLDSALTVEEQEDLGPHPGDESQGVLWRSGRSFYEREGAAGAILDPG